MISHLITFSKLRTFGAPGGEHAGRAENVESGDQCHRVAKGAELCPKPP
jgi:hypothetical protein